MFNLTDYILYLNIIILVLGTSSMLLGCSFLRREWNAKGFFKYSVFFLSMGNGLCCLGYSIMSLSPHVEVAYIFRLVGLIGIDMYIVAEIILMTSCLNFSKIAEYLITAIASIAACFDLFIYGHPDANVFIRHFNYTSYIRNDPYRHLFHYTYIGILTLCTCIIGLFWAFSCKYKRDKQLVFFAFVSNIILAASAIPDFLKFKYPMNFSHFYFCVGLTIAFTVFFFAANNYMTFYITVNSISRDIFSTLGTGLLVFDTNYHLNLSNEYANKLLGLDKDPHRIRLKEIFKLKSGEPMKMFEKATEGIAIDYRLTAEVTGKVTLVNFSCKMDRSNQPMCYILVATDLTEENRLVEEARAANEAKSAFLSNISHEIRTPINIILGMDELIMRECNDPTIIKYAENINVASRNLTSLINDVLDFSKIESGKLDIISTSYNVASVLNDCYNMFLNLAQEKNQDFSLICDPNIPSILKGDEVRLKQILSNLISNALKYTPDGNIVQVKANYRQTSSDSIILIFDVIDKGIGIKADDLPHLFENFQRFEISRNRAIQGTGLGLSITKNLVSLLNGTINVKSVYGEGTTFSVSIPQLVVDASPIGDLTEQYSEGRTKKFTSAFTAPLAHVLAVDDVQMNLDVFIGLLRDTMMQIDCALSGEEALDLMAKNHYDIIFLDHMMPEMDGIEVLKRLKIDENNPNINTPIIMLTANAMMGADRKYLEEGFNDYISKPIRPATLENILLKHLPEELIIPNEIAREEDADGAAGGKDSFLKKISGFLDTKAGLEFTAGDEDFYHQILVTYLNEDKRPRLEEFKANEDWPNYQIVAHSLKGTSLTIGAEDLSLAAKGLEFAVKENRLEYIAEHHDEVIKQYSELLDKLKEVLG